MSSDNADSGATETRKIYLRTNNLIMNFEIVSQLDIDVLERTFEILIKQLRIKLEDKEEEN